MKAKLPPEYDQEKKAILEKYIKKHKKILIGSLITILAAGSLTLSSSMIGKNKLKNLGENFPIYQEYTDNQKSLMYLENKLEQYKSEKLPEFLPKEVKNELENISIQEDPTKISSLEKTIKIVEQDSARIMNTPEFEEYSGKKERVETKWNFFYFLGLGVVLLSLPGSSFLSSFYKKRKDNEFVTLDKKYGLVPEEPQDSIKSSQ